MSMDHCVIFIEDIFHQYMYNTCVKNLISTIGTRNHSLCRYQQRKILSQNDYSYMRFYENNQLSTTILDEYAELEIIYIKFFKDSCDDKGHPIKEDWLNINCRDFDKFSEKFGYETATVTAIIASFFHIILH